MFSATATYPRACPDSSHFQSRLAHLAVGMTLLNASLFEQVDSTFPCVLSFEHSGSFSRLLRDAGWTHETRTSKTGLNDCRIQVLSVLLSFGLKHALIDLTSPHRGVDGGEILVLRFIQFSSVCFAATFGWHAAHTQPVKTDFLWDDLLHLATRGLI